MGNYVRSSVRGLVEYVYRSGSLDSTFMGTSVMVEGIRAHQKVQGTRGPDYQPEVKLCTEIYYNHFYFEVEGRCDGLIEGEQIVIDEIKSTRQDLDVIEEDYNIVHWAQAKFYGFMYCKEKDVREIVIQLTYYNVDNGETKEFQKVFTFDALKAFVETTLDRYIEFAKLKSEIQEQKIQSIKALRFPFQDYRKGQREMAVGVYRIIDRNGKGFINAPTGIGKTISTIFPSVKAMGEDKVEKIIYLTAKTIARTVAEETFDILEGEGAYLKVVTLTAKEKICFKEEVKCKKDYCEFANGYFDRLNDGIMDILKNETRLTRSVIERYAEAHQLCPFEFSLDLSLLADAVICDYNYYFDPRVSLKRMGDEARSEQVVLVDEAHNLVDRARDMFSATLNKKEILDCKRLFKDKDKKIFRDLEKLNKALLEISKLFNEEDVYISKEMPSGISKLVNNFLSNSEKWLTRNPEQEGHEELLDMYFQCNAFSKILKLYDERFVTYGYKEKKAVILKLFCLDPSFLIRQITDANKATVFFSATLLPHGYYRDILGGRDQDVSLIFDTPFDRERMEVLLSPLSTRYKDRETNRHKMTKQISELIKTRQGNFLVFFPSYAYMNTIYDTFVEDNPEVETMIQGTGMTEEARHEFLDRFSEHETGTVIAFAVMGGIFSEGIDLRGDKLTGVIVVGVGLPQICIERNIIKDYFNGVGKEGFDYAYVFPGMNKVMQAGGRLIRTEEDRGTLMLIDDRFLYRKYQAMFPYQWRHFKKIY